MTTHSVKATVAWFPHYLDGSKPFSVRRNDRDYQAGDLLSVYEWEPVTSTETGRWALFRIAAVWDSLPALDAGHCILTLKPCNDKEGRGGVCVKPLCQDHTAPNLDVCELHTGRSIQAGANLEEQK